MDTSSAPPVNLRKGVGIRTDTVILFSNGFILFQYSVSSIKLPLFSSSPRSSIGDLLKRCPIKEFGHDGISILE
jgi:hypothetical protein